MGAAGGKKGGAKQKVTDYYMSIHYGVCLGPIDAFTAIKIGERDIQITPMTANGYQDVTRPQLFGGVKEGGGVRGRIHAMLGTGSQFSPLALARRLLGSAVAAAKTPEEQVNSVPAYRGIASLFFADMAGVDPQDTVFSDLVGGGLGGIVPVWGRQSKDSFVWGSNYPQLPSMWVLVRRLPKGLPGDPVIESTIQYEEETGEKDEDKNDILRTVTRTLHNANPAHIIYECLTAPWGLNHPVQLIDQNSFLAAAETLREEEFGLSIKWDRQAKIESFIGDVLSHINGVCAVDPRTGQFYMKLLRDDYTVGSLPVITPDNAQLSEYQRKSWGETVNAVNVSWTNPVNEQTETVTEHDNANIDIQQTLVTDTKNYFGVRNPTLAKRLAQRDVRMSSRALVACVAKTDRSLWPAKPGDCVRLVWPEEGITSMVMRVGPVDPGNAGEPSMTLSLLEDIFAADTTEFAAQISRWALPGSDPLELDYLFTGGVPYFIVANMLGDDEAVTLEFPETYTLLLCAQDREDVLTTDFLSLRPNLTGTETYFPDGSVNNQSRGKLSTAMSIETTTDIYPLLQYVGGEPFAGMLVLIEDATDPTNFEMCAVETATPSSIVVRRGVLDTVPHVWPVGTPVWIIDPESRIVDSRRRSVGEEVVYKFLPKTSRGQLKPEDAEEIVVEVDDRQYRPYRPANVAVNGSDWGPLVVPMASTLEVTWSRRNRLTETAMVLAWGDGDVTPEAGQTTTIIVRRGVTVLATYSSLAGTDHDIDLSSFVLSPGDELTLEVYAERDGYMSLQGVQYKVTVQDINSGYGNGWGFDYE